MRSVWQSVSDVFHELIVFAPIFFSSFDLRINARAFHKINTTADLQTAQNVSKSVPDIFNSACYGAIHRINEVLVDVAADDIKIW
ncbi:hypothetical protein D3C87_1817720 [compost metagenome]